MSERVFDASVEQRFPATLNVDGDEIEIVHVLKPWDEASDAAIRDYLIAKAEADGADDEFDLELAAAKTLYKQLCISVEGIGEEGESLPSNWHDLIDELAIKKLVEDRIGVLVAVQESERTKKTVKWDAIKNHGNARRKARAFYNGEAVTVEATLRPVNAEVYRRVLSQSKQGNGKRLDAVAALFDELKVVAPNYAGRIPFHHRVSLGYIHLNWSNRLLEKN